VLGSCDDSTTKYKEHVVDMTVLVKSVGTLFRRATNAAGKSGRITGSSYPARFPGCYKSNAAGKSGWITGSSYPARFPGCICSTTEKSSHKKPFLRPWARLWFPALRLRFCARALRASGLTWLWPRMALAIRPCARDAAGGWSRSLSPTRSRTHDQWFLWERFSVVLQMQPGNRAG
jgi:hypothetical protein